MVSRLPLERQRALLGVGSALIVAALDLALAAGWVSGSPKTAYLATASVSVLQWLNLTVRRADSAFLRGGRVRFQLLRPQVLPSQVLQPQVLQQKMQSTARNAPGRAEPVFVLEAIAAVVTLLVAVSLSVAALGVALHPALYLAVTLLFCVSLVVILFPSVGAR